jgi:hypothetical protein
MQRALLLLADSPHVKFPAIPVHSFPKTLPSVRKTGHRPLFKSTMECTGLQLPDCWVTKRQEPIYLTPGRCYVNLTLLKGGGERVGYIQHAAYFDVGTYDIYGLGKVPERNWIVCLRKYTWSTVGGPE